jgi:hypothetical protein
MQEAGLANMLKVVNRSKPVPAKGLLAPISSTAASIEDEKRLIQSPEFTEHLTASFHRSKRRALAEAKLNAVQTD